MLGLLKWLLEDLANRTMVPLRFAVLIVVACLSAVTADPQPNPRTLVLLSDPRIRDSHSSFFDALKRTCPQLMFHPACFVQPLVRLEHHDIQYLMLLSWNRLLLLVTDSNRTAPMHAELVPCCRSRP